MPQNRLAKEASPYLLQHADNPVNWFPWGQEALAKAQKEQKLIFLSIGYAACHWCHVMENESFKDEEVASYLNQYFVSIKVDREERPDLDGIYMQAVLAMNGQGGWPLNIFLTPDQKPFFGGTYFPPRPRLNLPSFMDVIKNISQLWDTQREKLIAASEKLTVHLTKISNVDSAQGIGLNRSLLEEAAETMKRTYDWRNGGWGSAPKFPQAMSIDFLLVQASHGDKASIDMALHALSAMSQGGMYDLLGGGFARYSVDLHWRIPHFEKMLYDNALLSRAYLHGFMLSGNPRYKKICDETLAFLLAEMRDPSGGFYSSIDADSEGSEGKFYVWSLNEIYEIIQPALDAEIFTKAFGVSTEGNFEGKNILYNKMDSVALAEHFGLSESVILDKLNKAKSKLLSVRNTRVRPQTDRKILTFWNALTLSAFAEAAKYLNNARYLETAQQLANFLCEEMLQNNRLYRSWYEGRVNFIAYLEDYASLILGLLDLFMVDHNPRWYQFALRLANDMTEIYEDGENTFFETGRDHEQLIYRPKNLYDNATPSGNALAVLALAKLASFEGTYEWYDRARQMFQQVSTHVSKYPTSFAFWLTAADFMLGPVSEIVIVGNETQGIAEFTQAIWQTFRPRTISAVKADQINDLPDITRNRDMLKGKTTAYVCQYATCQMPVTTVEDMLSQIERIRER